MKLYRLLLAMMFGSGWASQARMDAALRRYLNPTPQPKRRGIYGA